MATSHVLKIVFISIKLRDLSNEWQCISVSSFRFLYCFRSKYFAISLGFVQTFDVFILNLFLDSIFIRSIGKGASLLSQWQEVGIRSHLCTTFAPLLQSVLFIETIINFNIFDKKLENQMEK